MAHWIAVTGIADGTNVEASVVNVPLYALTERTAYLYDRVNTLYGAGNFSAVKFVDVDVAADTAVGDIVYLDKVTGKYAKALASMTLTDNFTMDDSSRAIGILTAKSGSLGTVVSAGLVPITTSGLLQSGETFTAGPYYLSAAEAGKLTATPRGPAIYVGYFLAGYGIIDPQYKDVGLSHSHRSYRLYDQPAGQQLVTDPESPTGTHAILGFAPSVVDVTARQPQLIVAGTYTALEPTEYTFMLADSTGLLPPTDFTDLWVHWTSTDPVEGPGKTRLWSFDQPVAVGTKGITVCLENPTGADWDSPYADWDIPYSATSDEAGKRTWVVTVPEDTQGWLARRYRQTITPSVSTSYTLRLIGGPAVYADSRVSDVITVVCAEFHSFDFAEPTATQTTVIGTKVFEYTADGTVSDPDYIPVVLTGTAAGTAANLVTAILAQDISGVTPIRAASVDKFVICTPVGTTVTHAGSPVAGVNGTGDLTGTADLAVYDKDNVSLLGGFGYAVNVTYFSPIRLLNELAVMAVPFDESGIAADDDSVAVGATWTTDLSDEAPGARFTYALGMQASLVQHYPPIPVGAATFVLNGVELDSADMFENPAYRFGTENIYWYSNLWASVPWPADWESRSNPGSDHFQQKALIRFVQSGTGDTGFITSLQPAPNSPIKVTRCGTADAATVGDLALDVDLAMVTEDTNHAGYMVVKATTGQKLQRGPVVEKLVAGAGISLTQRAGAPSGQGVVVISSDTSAQYTGDFEEVALQNAKEELVGMFPYIRLLPWRTGSSNTPSGFVAKFRVPHTLPSTSLYRVIVYATVFGDTDVPYVVDGRRKNAGIQYTYSVLPDYFAEPPYDVYSNLKNTLQPAAVLTTSIPIGSDVTNPAYTSFDPMLIHNNPSEGADIDAVRARVLGYPLPAPEDFPSWGDPATLGVKPGALVGIRIQRAGYTGPSTDEYAGSIGFINLRWSLVTV